MLEYREGVRPAVLIRDLSIFLLKLVLDGFKDLVLVKLSILAALADLVVGGRRRGRFFYGLMNASERFDLWLNVYGSARHAGSNPDGLFGESRAGDDTLLGEIEELVRGRPEPYARPAQPVSPRVGLPPRGR